MSTEIGFIKHSGSCDLQVTRYFGGVKNGMCLQLTGSNGYVQLNKKDMIRLIKIWQKEIGELGLSNHKVNKIKFK